REINEIPAARQSTDESRVRAAGMTGKVRLGAPPRRSIPPPVAITRECEVTLPPPCPPWLTVGIRNSGARHGTDTGWPAWAAGRDRRQPCFCAVSRPRR